MKRESDKAENSSTHPPTIVFGVFAYEVLNILKALVLELNWQTNTL